MEHPISLTQSACSLHDYHKEVSSIYDLLDKMLPLTPRDWTIEAVVLCSHQKFTDRVALASSHLFPSPDMPSPPPQFRLTNLPVELQREIFCSSALGNMPDAIRLVRVSKLVYHWISPVIYNMVTLGSDDTVLFMRTLASKPAVFFATNVKSLCLSISVEPRDAERILAVCTGVRSLAFWVDYISTLSPTSMYHLISPLPLRRLSIEVHHLHALCHSAPGEFGNPSHPWHARLTHLDIVFWEDDDEPGVLSYLTQLKSLTRLGLWNPRGLVHEGFVSHILDACEQLEILLLVIDEDDSAHTPPTFQDPRVVIMPYPPQIVQDWEALFAGQPNTWSRATEVFFANAKARRESDGNSGETLDVVSARHTTRGSTKL